MPIQRQTNVDYEALCKELGVTIDELIELVKNKDKHKSEPAKTYFLNQVIDAYSENLTKLREFNRRSDNTLTTYLNFLERVKTFIDATYPQLKIGEVNESMVFEMLKKSIPRKNEKLATNTINKYMAIMRSLLGFAFERGYTEKDVRYKLPLHSSPTLPRYLNDVQVEQVLNGAIQKTYGYRKKAMIRFMLGTGCRVSEMTNLKIKDFNVDEDLIFIRKGKGNKERYIPIFEEVKMSILKYLKISGVSEWRQDIEGYLFSQDEGLSREKKVLDRSVQYLVRGLFDEIGLGRDYTVHSLRHTFAVNCLKSGIEEPFLMQMLGHEDPKTTSVYTKLLPKDLKEEVMKFYPFPFEDLLDELI
ncbi:tyrosine-type recombinase/integrase [Virgibacillus doumboii]|uniref:tyrosine-type recombinase/integrase n=1 Tax=Virgibacillus doumboii TaxID=2697503 RepID=UPI0013DFE14F|nr:tyrosine-type recombinase/integrase [Virgibacillus doumboii]